MEQKGELGFIGCGMSALFLYETLESAADRGYGVIIEPVGPEQARGFNLYQVTPSKALACQDMYEALDEVFKAQPHLPLTVIQKITLALSKAEAK